jgi:PAS domain S-box-containing protein
MTGHRAGRVLGIGVTALLLTSALEILKTLLFPRLSLWGSHFITITVVTLGFSTLVWRATRASGGLRQAVILILARRSARVGGRRSEAKARVPFMARRVTFTALLTLSGMLAYESTKQALFPDISIWESHLVTIVFSTLVATVAAYLAFRRYEHLNGQLSVALSESQRSKGALQESEQRYRSVVLNAGEGICTLDADGCFRLANPACDDIFGVVHGALVGRRFDEFLATRAKPGEHAATEVTIVRPAGERRTLLVTSVPLHEAGQDQPGWMRICVDITEQRRSAEALGHAQRLAAVGMLAGGVAHEFNNVHFAVLGCLELAIRQPEPAKSAAWLTRARDAIERASGITHSLLSFANARNTSRSPTAINDVVREVLAVLHGQLQAAGVDVTTSLGDLPPLPLDDGQISQVVMNLVINAQQAMLATAEKRLAVETGTKAGRAFIRVNDSGCGIPYGNVPKLFHPFFSTKGKHARGDPASAGVAGAGLGLSLCERIVRVHGGEIEVESVEGKGSAFTVWLPLEECRAPESPTVVANGSTEHAAAVPLRGRILLIDDEELVRSVVAEMLRERGHVVQTAAGGEEALEALERSRFDVVMVDLEMPGFNGVQLLERLQGVSVAQRPLLFIVTAKAIADDLASQVALGVVDMLLKPFTRDELLGRIARLLAKGRGVARPDAFSMP